MKNQTRFRTIWRDEEEFFDRAAEMETVIGPMDPLAVERYGAARLRDRYQKEYRIRLLGDLRGKRVLDVGCGTGVNTVLLAILGAQVTGVDVSGKALEVARLRARASGVDDRVRFECRPLEELDPKSGPFDAVWCDSVLHHLLPVLDTSMEQLRVVGGRGAVFCAYEPVSRSRLLRRIRGAIPVRTDATPDERPLEPPEIELISSYLSDARLRYFGVLGRLDRFVLGGRILERVSPPRRATVDLISQADDWLLRIPGAEVSASRVVIHGQLA